MITEKTLPQEIQEIALRYKEDNDKLDVFLVKLVVDDFGHYVIRYLPSMTSLVIREDGEVLPFNQAIKMVMISATMDRTADLLRNGLKWKRDRRVLEGIKNTVKHFMDKYQKDAPTQVLEAMKEFMELPDKIIEHQYMIEKFVREGIQYMKKVGRQGVVTESELDQIKKYRNDMLYHIYLQSEIQLQTEKNREEVLSYLKSKIPLWNMFDRPVYWYLRLQNRNLFSKKRYPDEVKEMERIRKIIFEGAPLLEKEETQQIFDRCKNPR